MGIRRRAGYKHSKYIPAYGNLIPAFNCALVQNKWKCVGGGQSDTAVSSEGLQSSKTICQEDTMLMKS